MHEIFVNHRRIDTEDLARLPYRDLCRSFGASGRFMDTSPGGIPWGSEWRCELDAAPERCEALLALGRRMDRLGRRDDARAIFESLRDARDPDVAA